MATYNELKTDQYYLIKEKDTKEIMLAYVLMETEKAVFLEFEDEAETMVWRKKSDTLEEIVEELTEEQADLYESIVYEEEDEDGFSWEDLEEDDDEDELSDDDDDDDNNDTGGNGNGGRSKTRKLFS